MPVLLQNNTVIYKGKIMTVTIHHTNDSQFTYRNVTKIDCDGEVVAIHFYNQKREIESAFYELGFDPKHSECTITSYEVNA
jgi:hypothetical protein